MASRVYRIKTTVYVNLLIINIIVIIILYIYNYI